MSSGYNEHDLSADTIQVHRALASLQEELEAVDYYQQRADRETDAALKAILEHNRDEEVEHATMLFEYLRRKLPAVDAAMKKYLFTTQPLTQIEAAGAAASRTAGDLSIGGLK